MSTATIHTPGFDLPRGTGVVIAFPTQRRATARTEGRRDVERRAVECPGAAPSAAPLRLTRRGRLVVSLLIATVLVVVGLAGARTALAGDTAAPASVEQVTVLPGDTLWSIATASTPGGDVRDTVAEIRELNALQSSTLVAGQELLVPAG